MKRTGSAKLKIIAATSMVIFSLAAAFSGAYAWFNSASKVEGESEGMPITPLAGKLKKVSFHPYTAKTIGSDTLATSLTFSNTPVGTITYDWQEKTGTYVATSEGDTRIVLQDYQPLSPQQPLLIFFELDREYSFSVADGMYIRAVCEADDFLGTRAANNKPAHVLKYQYQSGDVVPDPHDEDYDERTDLTKDGLFRGRRLITRVGETQAQPGYFYALSSVSRFYSFGISQTQYNSLVGEGPSFTIGDGTSRLDFNSLIGTNSNRAEDFVTVDNDAETSSFDDDQTANVFSAIPDETIKYVALFIDYYPDAIEYIYSTYLGDTTLEAFYDGYLFYECDWAMEVF